MVKVTKLTRDIVVDDALLVNPKCVVAYGMGVTATLAALTHRLQEMEKSGLLPGAEGEIGFMIRKHLFELHNQFMEQLPDAMKEATKS